MEILDKIGVDLKEALKAHEDNKVQTLRYILAQIHNREIEKGIQGKGLSNEEVIEVLRREAKKRREAAEIFKKGGREDLFKKEEEELKFFDPYLPKAAETGEIEAVVREVMTSGGKEFGAIMKEVVARFKGQADGRVVSEIVKKKLEEK